MKIAVLSASLGGFDARQDHVKQTVDCDYFHFTDENFPPRDKSMTPRLQARIVKMFGWQMVPDYDIYLWVDSSHVMTSPDAVQFLYTKLAGGDVTLFEHPNRDTVEQEADYLKQRLSINCPYITPRYKNELIDEQMAAIEPDGLLYASTIIMYRNNKQTQDAFKEWWYHTSRFHSIDQLSLPYVTRFLSVRTITNKHQKEYFRYVR